METAQAVPPAPAAPLMLAVAEEQLQLRYQPMADLRSGSVVRFEALLYWQHPQHGLLHAWEFLPQADDREAAAVGAWTLRRAAADLRDWRRIGRPPLPVSLDISPAQFCDPGLSAQVAALLGEHGLPADALGLEISEDALAAAGDQRDELLDGYRTHGLGLTLDDFGNGPASLSNLGRYAWDAMKITAAFVRHVVADPQAAAICSSMIAMGQQLGITVVADGVADEAQCDLLRRHMCDQVQGEFFAAPMPAAALEAWLADLPALPAHLRRLHQPTRRLLLVDDEPNILSALKRLLRSDGYQIYTAADGPQGLAVLASQQIDVIVSDQRMPGMLGADFLRKARAMAPESIRIMLSGYTELQSVTDAVNEGAIYKFLSKPWDDEQLRAHVADAFNVKQHADAIARLHLEVRSANQELAAANRRMEQLLEEKQRQIRRDEISLNVAREVLQHLPLPVLGMDDTGMIAFVNQAAQALLRDAGALLGEAVADVLPELGMDSPPHSQTVHVGGRCYAAQVYPMGGASRSRGSLITLGTADGAAP